MSNAYLCINSFQSQSHSRVNIVHTFVCAFVHYASLKTS